MAGCGKAEERERLCHVIVLNSLANKNTSCLQEYSNSKWTLYSCHCCIKLCSKALLRELEKKSCCCWRYLQLAEPAKIGE
jgi:hypothetical protein